MATDTTIPESRSKRRRLGALSDYWGLIRPRIVGMVLFTMAVAALIAGEDIPGWTRLANGLLGSGLVIAGAIALNQRLESHRDAKMARTAWRPVASGRLPRRNATLFGVGASVVGILYLWYLVNPGIVVLALVSWVIYVWLYTPLKVFTAWQTPIGAVAGAMPTLLGAAAVYAPMSPVALTLFGLVFFWQFPHAMAIAWLYREQFAMAESKVATVVDPSGRTAGWLSVVGAAALIPVALVPVFTGEAGWAYGAFALLLTLCYLWPSIRFLVHVGDATARTLLRVSFLYLPIIFIALLIAVLV